MAPIKISSTDVELFESPVSKPNPLRIIKRSQTVTGGLSSREAFNRGRQSSSCSSLKSKGSPPMGADRPLTVRKKRQGIGSNVNVSSEDKYWDKENEQPFTPTSGATEFEDPDITPKARLRVTRTISAGNFVKNEFHRRSLEEQGRYSVRSNRNSFYPPQAESHTTLPLSLVGTPKAPERQTSKSKSFILRALAGRSKEESSYIQSVNFKGHRNTLARRLSKGKTMDSGRSRRISMSGETLYSLNLEDLDSANANINDPAPQSETPAGYVRPLPAIPQDPTPLRDMLVLSPRIKITPEVNSLPTTGSILWVVIEIRGELHAADSRYDMHPGSRICSSELENAQSLDLSRYGHMYAMGIDIMPPHGCDLLDVIGDHNVFRLRPRETHLMLAKIRVGGVDDNPSPPTRDPEILIAELQNDLGETLTHYLNVQATYKHTGFTRWESNYATREGSYVHSTFLFTEARVGIKRHNVQSAWSPRGSQTTTSTGGIPQSDLFRGVIERHLPAARAAEVLNIVYNNAPNRIRANGQANPIPRGLSRMDAAATPPMSQTSLSVRKKTSHVVDPDGPVVRHPPAHVRRDQGLNEDEEIDPARLIWESMREVSTGGRAYTHQRQSISADHFTSIDNSHSPTRLASTQSSDGALQYQPFENRDASIELERTKIKEVALKNKRSLGTETSRNMAPNVPKNGKGKQAAAGLGLRVGGWGWGNFFG